MTDSLDPSDALASLGSSLDRLEQAVAPLLASPLGDTLSELSTPQQAKLQVFLGYMVHDLTWIYLKTRGLSPADHPVTAELDRIKAYFGKLKAATAAAAPEAAASHPRLDKDAAARFINHAIASASSTRPAAPRDRAEVHAGEVVLPEIRQVVKGKHKRFDDDGQSEEGNSDLEVFDGEEAKVELAAAEPEPAKAKRRGTKRPKMDPFAGYDEPSASAPSPATSALKSTKKKRKKDKTAKPAS